MFHLKYTESKLVPWSVHQWKSLDLLQDKSIRSKVETITTGGANRTITIQSRSKIHVKQTDGGNNEQRETQTALGQKLHSTNKTRDGPK